MRHWYVTAQSDPKKYGFESLQDECDQIALYVRNHILADFCMDSPTPELVSSMKKDGVGGDSDAPLTFEEARQRLGLRQPRVTDPGTCPTIPSSSAWSSGPPRCPEFTPAPPARPRTSVWWSEGHDGAFERAAPAPMVVTDPGTSQTLHGAPLSPVTEDSPDSGGDSLEMEAKKARSEPNATATEKARSEPKATAWPVVQPVQMHRGPGFNLVCSPPMLMAVGCQQMPVNPASMPWHPKAMPKGNKASSSGAAGAQREDYNEVFGPSGGGLGDRPRDH